MCYNNIMRTTTQAKETIMRDLKEYVMAIRAELDKAPGWKVGTKWWNDRIRELQACLRRLEMARK